ncbi:MAG: cyclic nucleotide-binding domain-containing protein, partial [Acidobacteria bacterium]
GTKVTLPRGAVLFELGAPADSVYIVTGSRLSLTLPMMVGGREEHVLIEERQTGQALGWSALIPPHRFTLTASAPFGAEVLQIPREALAHHLKLRPEIGYLVMRNVAEIIGQRLQVFQAMWLREMQRVVELAAAREAAS